MISNDGKQPVNLAVTKIDALAKNVTGNLANHSSPRTGSYICCWNGENVDVDVSIACSCLSFRQLLATLEVGPKSNVVIYEIMPPRRRKAIGVQIAAKHEEKVAFAFSGDAKLLAILVPESATVPSSSNNANYTISLYLWRTGKVLASVNLGSAGVPTFCPQVTKLSDEPVTRSGIVYPLSFQLSFNPTDANSVAVVYSGSLRFYRLSPDGLETTTKPKLSGHIITCHAWITSSRLVTGTTTGLALIVEDGDIISKIPLVEDKSGPQDGRC